MHPALLILLLGSQFLISYSHISIGNETANSSLAMDSFSDEFSLSMSSMAFSLVSLLICNRLQT